MDNYKSFIQAERIKNETKSTARWQATRGAELARKRADETAKQAAFLASQRQASPAFPSAPPTPSQPLSWETSHLPEAPAERVATAPASSHSAFMPRQFTSSFAAQQHPRKPMTASTYKAMFRASQKQAGSRPVYPSFGHTHLLKHTGSRGVRWQQQTQRSSQRGGRNPYAFQVANTRT